MGDSQMGLETVCLCRVDDLSGEAKVLLEPHEMILRAPFRLSIKIGDMTKVEAVGDELRLSTGSAVVVLVLGAATASKWATRIATPPPSLAKKLGIGHSAPAFVIGRVDEPALLDALEQHTAEPPLAKLSLAVVHDASELGRALAVHDGAMGTAPIWVVHEKGPNATFGEGPVRTLMRDRGFRDTKVSAVSTTLTATRYSRA